MKKENKYKILSLILAFILWYFVVWGKPIETTIQIPLEAKLSKDANYKIEFNPSQVDVKLEATRSNLRNIDFKNFQLQIDLSKYSQGVYQVRVPVENLKLNNIKIKEVTPSYVMVIIKKISTKKVPIKVKFSEKIPRRISLIIEPSIVSIKGVWDDIKNISEVTTRPIDFEELQKEKIIYVELEQREFEVEIEPKKVKIVYLAR